MNKWFNKYSMQNVSVGQRERAMANSFVFHKVSAKKQLSWCKVSEVGEERPICQIEELLSLSLGPFFFFFQQKKSPAIVQIYVFWSGKAGQQGGMASLSSWTSMVQGLKLSTAVGAENELGSGQWIFMMDDCIEKQTVYKCKINEKDLFQCKISTCPRGFV